MRGALEDLPGIEQMRIEFDRREVTIRYDPGIVDAIRFIDAINAIGGYAGAIRYGPVPSGVSFDSLLSLPEDSLAIPDTAVAHSAFTVLDSEQFNRNLRILEETQSIRDLDISGKKFTVVYVSLWTTVPKIIPHAWRENTLLHLSGGETFLAPIRWIPMARHIEDDGSGSEVGMLLFPPAGTPELLHEPVLLLGQLTPSQNNKVNLLKISS